MTQQEMSCAACGFGRNSLVVEDCEVGNCPEHPERQDDDDFDDPHESDEPYEDCGMLSDGTCMKVGSEECDWECGALDEED